MPAEHRATARAAARTTKAAPQPPPATAQPAHPAPAAADDPAPGPAASGAGPGAADNTQAAAVPRPLPPLALALPLRWVPDEADVAHIQDVVMPMYHAREAHWKAIGVATKVRNVSSHIRWPNPASGVKWGSLWYQGACDCRGAVQALSGTAAQLSGTAQRHSVDLRTQK